VATPDAPSAQTPARRQPRAAVQPAVGAAAPPAGAGNTQAGVQSTIQVGNQCFRPTDSRGYGYWTSCDQVYTFVLGRGLRDNALLDQLDRSSDGGGGDGR